MAASSSSKIRLLAFAATILSLVLMGSLGYLYIQAREELDDLYGSARMASVKHFIVLNNQMLVLESWVREGRDPECIAPVLASIESEASTLARYSDLMYERTGDERYAKLGAAFRDLAVWAHTGYNLAWAGEEFLDQFNSTVYGRHESILEVTLVIDDMLTHTYLEEIPEEKIERFYAAVRSLVEG